MAVLAALFVVAGIGLTAAVVVAHHRGGDGDFGIRHGATRWAPAAGMGRGNGNGNGNGKNKNRGQGNGDAPGRANRQANPANPATRTFRTVWVVVPAPRSGMRCCTVSSRRTSPGRRR